MKDSQGVLSFQVDSSGSVFDTTTATASEPIRNTPAIKSSVLPGGVALKVQIGQGWIVEEDTGIEPGGDLAIDARRPLAKRLKRRIEDHNRAQKPSKA